MFLNGNFFLIHKQFFLLMLMCGYFNCWAQTPPQEATHKVVSQVQDQARVARPEMQAEANLDKTDVSILCRRDKSVRWLRAFKLDNGKCKTIYSKEGYLQVVSSATFFSSCEVVLLSIKKNIEEGGFKCSPMSVSVIDLENN